MGRMENRSPLVKSAHVNLTRKALCADLVDCRIELCLSSAEPDCANPVGSHGALYSSIFGIRSPANARPIDRHWFIWSGCHLIDRCVPAERLAPDGNFALLIAIVALNSQFYVFLAAKRGCAFALAAVPFHFLYHLYNGIDLVLESLAI